MDYEPARRLLIREDRKLRLDQDEALVSSLGDVELLNKADAIFRFIKSKEAEGIWALETDQIPHIFPGMEFLTAKDTIQSTTLFEIVQKMPKGALLHAHMDAMCDADFLYKRALREPRMHVRVSERLTDESWPFDPQPQFTALPDNFPCGSVTNLSDPNYQLESWVPLQEARRAFSQGRYGGWTGFDGWVISSMRINPVEAYEKYNTSKKIWKKFASTFGVAGGLLGFEPVLKDYFRELLTSSVTDGISYVEARINFFDRTMRRANGEDDFSHAEWLSVFSDVIATFKAELHNQGRSDEFVGAKVIYTTLRFITVEELEWYLEDCIALKRQFPHLIAGFDLVGHEDVGYPLLYYHKALLAFQDRVQSQGLQIPFIFHAGETMGDGDKVDENLYDAILLGTRRIGHGYSLVKHPHLMSLCRERGIAVECCPISNEILRLTSSMPAHPLPIMLNNGVPIALACDDPAVFGNMGLSYDFFQVAVSSEATGLKMLGLMAKQSLRFTELDPDEREEAEVKWTRRWHAFLDDIVHRYGSSLKE